MNKKMNLIKKRLLNVCSKLIQSTPLIEQQEANKSESVPIKKIKRHSNNRVMNRKTSSIISKANSYSSALSVSSISRSESKCRVKSKKTSASSGYGTSIKSTMSVFMNLDNYFYDENFNKVIII